MIYNLPELDRMSRALSRLETALLTKRTALPASQNAINDSRSHVEAPTDLEQENQMLRLQCQEMRQQLQQAHLLLAEILGHDVTADRADIDGADIDGVGASDGDELESFDSLESTRASADKLRLGNLRNDNDEEHNG
ncbi:MAG: hypothetical protein K0U39_07120 [Alphaproteobacteria bacterium]|nr:hypothetical protein [Alphaproteobacteria bacterium]